MSRTSTKKDDPLAGWRDEINAGRLHRLAWPDEGRGAPVKVGETFELRSCWVEVTRVHRTQKGSRFMWQAVLARHPNTPTRRYFPTGSATRPYTNDPNLAERSPEDHMAALTLHTGDADHNAHRPPADEVIAPDEVAHLPTTVAARARYEQINREDTEKRLDRSMTSKLREVRIRARQVGADVSTEMEVIAEATESARRKVRKAAA